MNPIACSTSGARAAVVSTLATLLCASGPLFAAEEFKPLFDGKTLGGWVQRGGKAAYAVEDGCILGATVKGTPNSFLCTEKSFGNFILELEIKADKELNSGVQIRSHCYDQPTRFVHNGKTNTIAAGRVHGYQIEVDQRADRRWSGGIYEEGRRGWLQDLEKKPEAQAAFKLGEWNQYRIECNGDWIRTWVNGVPVADLHDSGASEGFIALQVHSASTEGLQVRFRNIRLAQLGGDGAKSPSRSEVQPAGDGVRVTKMEDRVRVEINGKLFTEYRFKDVPKPFCYPVLLGDAAMTRKWPLEETKDEERDHPHHQGLWFGHQKVNGHNFWTVAAASGKIVQEDFVSLNSGEQSGSFTTQNKWVAKDGTVILRDERTLRFYNRANDRILDWEVTLKATEGDVTFADDKDGLAAIRVAETMRVLKPLTRGEKAKAGDGHIVLSTGVKDDGASAAEAKDAKREAQTWGKSAAWCDYYGPVDGKTVGVAIFDHPANPRHPTWWHVRDYGLFAANPLGKHYFERLPDANAGNLTIPKGQTATFRYRFYFHEGDTSQAKVAAQYDEYTKSITAK